MEFDIFNNAERPVRCIGKFDTFPYTIDCDLLEVGKEYTVTDVDVHESYTMIELKEFPDSRFNSVLFEEIEG